jgi:hypothetical protein
MANFSAQNGAFTPATNTDNYTLDADTAGDVGKVKMISWGGRGTTSTGYRTRWTRPSTNASSTFTSLVPVSSAPTVAVTCRCGTFATAATLPSDPSNLFAIDWNVLGGGGVIVLPIGGEWIVTNSATAGHQQISCRNVAGTDASLSSYGIQWEE